MTNSALIVFLPLVAAFVGAIIGACANSWYRNREAKKAEDRERKGLLLLIGGELLSNYHTFCTVTKRDVIASHLRTEVWDESRARFAQLLPSNHLEALVGYYGLIVTIRDDWAKQNVDISENDKVHIRNVWTLGKNVIRNAQQYVSIPESMMGQLKYDPTDVRKMISRFSHQQ